MTISAILPKEAKKRIANGAALIDIREPDEHAHENIPEAHLMPLSAIENGARLGPLDPHDVVIFHCQSGMRSSQHAEKLAALAEPAQVMLLAGGLEAWKKDGQEIMADKSQPLPIMRQVQIVAGALILLGVVLGYAVNSGFFLLSGAVGAGLLFAGISGFCGMARLLARLPWNRR